MSKPIEAENLNDALQLYQQVLGSRQMINSLNSEIPQAIQRISGSLSRNLDLLHTIPNLQLSRQLLEVRDVIEKSLVDYEQLRNVCAGLSLEINSLLSNMTILVCSPTCTQTADEVISREGSLIQRFNDVEDSNQNLLNSLDQLTYDLLTQSHREDRSI